MEDELEMDVDGDDDQNDAEDIDVVGDAEHDDEGVVDDDEVVEEDIEDELADVSPPHLICIDSHSRLFRMYQRKNRRQRSRSLLGSKSSSNSRDQVGVPPSVHLLASPVEIYLEVGNSFRYSRRKA